MDNCESTETNTTIAINFNGILQQSLSPILEKLSYVENENRKLKQLFENRRIFIIRELTTIKRELEYTKWELNNTKHELENTNKELETTDLRYAETITDLIKLENRHKELDTKVAKLSVDLSKLENTNTELNSKVENTITELNNTKREIQEFKLMINMVNRHEEWVKKTSHNLTRKLNDTVNKFKQLNTKLECTITELNNTICELNDTKTELIQLNQKTNYLSTTTDLNQTKRELENTKTQLNQLLIKTLLSTTTITELNARIETISLTNNQIADTPKTDLKRNNFEPSETNTTISINFKDILQQSLSPIMAKLRNFEKDNSELKELFEKTIIKQSNTECELRAIKRELEDTRQELNARIVSNNELLDTTRTELENTKTQLIELTLKTNELSTTTITELNNTKVMLQQEIKGSIPTGNVAYFSSKTAPDGWLKANGQSVLMLQQEIIECIPPGTIAYFAYKSAPYGWLKANGVNVSRTTYADLFSKIGNKFGSGDGNTTFTLPDLRGEFIRGYDDGRDVDKDRNIGSFQWGSSIPMAGHIEGSFRYIYSPADHSRWGFAGKTFDDGFEGNVDSGQTRNGITFPNDKWENELWSGEMTDSMNNDMRCITNWNVLKGTRPRNIALLACIKY